MFSKDPVIMECAEKFENDIAEIVGSFAEIYTVGSCGKFKHLVMRGVYKGLLESTGYRLLSVARKLEESPAPLSALISVHLGRIAYVDVPSAKYAILQDNVAKNDDSLINIKEGSNK